MKLLPVRYACEMQAYGDAAYEMHPYEMHPFEDAGL
jgi:hypothetical protein